jgi:hypothetical protein
MAPVPSVFQDATPQAPSGGFEPPNNRQPAGVLMSDTIAIRSFPNRIAAEAAEAVLRTAGVEAVVVSDDAGGAAPHIGYTTGGARLMVRRSQAEQARRLLDELGG